LFENYKNGNQIQASPSCHTVILQHTKEESSTQFAHYSKVYRCLIYLLALRKRH